MHINRVSAGPDTVVDDGPTRVNPLGSLAKDIDFAGAPREESHKFMVDVAGSEPLGVSSLSCFTRRAVSLVLA